MECKNIELKAYKMLAEIRKMMLSRINSKLANCVEYRKGNPEEIFEIIQNLTNPEKWDYCSLLDEEDKKVLETLEYLIDDEMAEIRNYKEWKPHQRV